MNNTIKIFIEFGDNKFAQVVKLANNFPYIIGSQAPGLSIKDPRLSQRHCQFVIELGKLFIEDLGGSNGVELNGSSIKKSRIKIDDQIRVGNTRIKILKIDLASNKIRKTGDFL